MGTVNVNYNPKTFEEDHIFDSRGILGWLGRRRKEAISETVLLFSRCSKGLRVLDAGCGYGEILEQFKGLMRVGLDVNLNALMHAQRIDGEACYILCDIENLPLKGQSFDIVICSEVLEHVNSPIRATSQIIEATKNGGYICVTVPNEWVTTLGRFVLKKRPFKSPAHKTSFTWTRLKKLFHDQSVICRRNVPFSFLPFHFSTNLIALFQKK
ncbi:MAG: class I SAM-dependent methyltransferase [Thermodesulfobacteriota bacterium]